MAIYSIVGLKSYDPGLFDSLSHLVSKEQMDIIRNKRRYRDRFPILMYDSNPTNYERTDELNEKYGEHSNYLLFNEHALKMLNDHQVKPQVLGTLELEDPMTLGFALLIRNDRFI